MASRDAGHGPHYINKLWSSNAKLKRDVGLPAWLSQFPFRQAFKGGGRVKNQVALRIESNSRLQ
jgi:hypothetical protein